MDLTAAGILTERAVDPAAFAIAGRTPRLAVRPADRDELCEVLRAAARDGLAVVPWGGGVGLAGSAAPDRYDLAIDLGALDRVVEYEPEDLTLTAECGATLATLGARLAAHGQELPLEGAQASRATLGGTLAANASGPRRMRLGGPRDRILGARFALGDGTLVRTGGKVVKNVAGYGIHRLLCGSRGGLAILVDASLKLLPAPAARAAFLYDVDAETLADRARWAPFPRSEPAVLTVARGAESRKSFRIAIGFEDDPPRIAEQRALVTRALGAPGEELESAGAEALWRGLADLEGSTEPQLTFASAHLTPDAIAPLAADAALGAWAFHAACGRLHVRPEPADIPGLIGRLAEAGFALIEARGIEAEPAIPPALATVALRRRIRAALDPGGRFALGARWERASG